MVYGVCKATLRCVVPCIEHCGALCEDFMQRHSLRMLLGRFDREGAEQIGVFGWGADAVVDEMSDHIAEVLHHLRSFCILEDAFEQSVPPLGKLSEGHSGWCVSDAHQPI